ncbi:hypothetical protein ACPEIC_46065 [Stenotrophomonas sp. NPDC087984]
MTPDEIETALTYGAAHVIAAEAHRNGTAASRSLNTIDRIARDVFVTAASGRALRPDDPPPITHPLPLAERVLGSVERWTTEATQHVQRELAEHQPPNPDGPDWLVRTTDGRTLLVETKRSDRPDPPTMVTTTPPNYPPTSPHTTQTATHSPDHFRVTTYIGGGKTHALAPVIHDPTTTPRTP